jgi:hypothetical protein
LYNVLPVIGLQKITSEDDLKRVAVQLQQDSIPFAGLVKIFGREITLGQLELLEEALKTEVPATA